MPADRDPDQHAGARAALVRCWLMGRRLARARRRVVWTLPTSPERLAGLGQEDAERVDVFLFRLGAAVTALVNDVMEPVLLAEHRRIFFLDVAEDLRMLEATGAIASAEQVLAIRERVWRHYLIATLAPEPRAAALNEAWADGQAMADVLAGLVRHIHRKGLVPGFSPFEPGPALREILERDRTPVALAAFVAGLAPGRGPFSQRLRRVSIVRRQGPSSMQTTPSSGTSFRRLWSPGLGMAGEPCA